MFRHVTTRFSGLIILVAGLWGGLIPFLGPTFHFTLGPDHAWTWTSGRLWLSVLPAAAAVLGGLILMGGGPRLSGRFGALIALAGGIWFAAGPDVSMLWNHGVSQAGVAHGHHAITRMLEYLTLHSGIGVLITALAAYSLPGAAAYTLGRRRVAQDAAVAGTGAAAGAAETRHRDRVAARETAPVGAGAAAAGTAAAPAAERTAVREPAAERTGVREPMAEGTAVREPVANGAADAPTANGTTAEGTMAERGAGAGVGTQTAPRRRGGLAGLFSRR